MAKKRRRTKYVSRGLRPSISPADCKLVRQDRTEGDKLENKFKAWMRGKKVFETIPNPNPEETNRRFIRMSMDTLRGGTYKEVRSRVKRSDDRQQVEI